MTKQPMSIDARRERYYRLSLAIALMDDRRLQEIFASDEATRGWGHNHVLDVGRDKVFVKRVPLTDLENENRFSTRNYYDLPTYYNYGIGSAGFGVFRELVANIKATNWVLAGEIETFPLLYHYRILQRERPAEPPDLEWLDKYIPYWGGSEAIRRYMVDRANAGHEMVLFLEHIPTVYAPWLGENSSKTSETVGQLIETVHFLRKKGMIHFDAHYNNVLTDGKRVYLTDFGLALDKSFDLTPEERAFFQRHLDYDFAEVVSCLSYPLYGAFDALSEEDQERLCVFCGVDYSLDPQQRMRELFRRIERVRASEMLKLHDNLFRTISYHFDSIMLVREFYGRLRESPGKDTPFPHVPLRKLLRKTGVLPVA